MNQFTRLWSSILEGTTFLSNDLWKRKASSIGSLNCKNARSSLWLTNLPSKKKRAIILSERKKFRKHKNYKSVGQPLLIECRRPELNHRRGAQFRKFDVIPLASKAWHHKKSKGDHFTILRVTEHPAFLTNTDIKGADTFESIGLSSKIIEQLNKLEINYPTVIQAKSIPEVLQGKNVLITAETGCGKTLTYLAPIADKVLQLKEEVPTELNAPFAVILLPTRELAVQIGALSHKLCSNLGINCMTLLGGKTKRMLLNPVKEVTDILVCTPGVLSKMMSCNMFSMQLCKHLVLDEADTLLDDSFSEKIKYFINKARMKFGNRFLLHAEKQSQMCLVSATMPKNLESIGSIINVENLVEISTNYLHRIQPHVPQKFVRIGISKKPEELLKILKQNVFKNIPTMIFCNKTPTSNWLNLFLNENGIKSIRINAAMNHETRLKQYQMFRDGFINIICCTDIASRGLDSTRVKHVINYDFPRFMADYIHRCGRTGRIGHDENCLITNFISSAKELPLVQSIEKSARTSSVLQNVNNNIAGILKDKHLKEHDGMA